MSYRAKMSDGTYLAWSMQVIGGYHFVSDPNAARRYSLMRHLYDNVEEAKEWVDIKGKVTVVGEEDGNYYSIRPLRTEATHEK